MSENRKLWGGRFSGSTSEITEALSSSIEFDSRLYAQDIRGSQAHARMLLTMGILNEEELQDIIRGLDEIKNEIELGSFPFSSKLEDIHMNIEARLTERIGEAGKKLHTGRSRNDQVAVDTRLYVRDIADELEPLLKGLIDALITQAEANLDTLLPGYTHLQVAQPVRFSHHLLAYAWMLVRDLNRLRHTREAADVLPLGSGALAGVNYRNDREFLKSELAFSDITLNSMDAVSDRDFIMDFLYFSAVLGAHLSRLSEDIILWSSSEFAFVRLADEVTTGSSIMPQKRNPDLAELIRGKTGRLYGNLMRMLTTMKGLPMTYNRDLQEDKEPLFDSVDTVELSLRGMTAMISGMTVNRSRMKEAVYSNFSTATDLADYLVKKGMPFRQCHEVVGSVVRYCEEKGKDFFTLPIEELQQFTELIEKDVYEVLSPENSTERKESLGSTARGESLRQIEELRRIMGE